MGAIKNIFSDMKVIVLIIALILALIAINPDLSPDGVAIRSVAKNSSAAIAGIEPPSPQTPPMSKEKITRINNIPIKTLEDYYNVLAGLQPNVTIQLKTSKSVYRLITRQKEVIIHLNETVDEQVYVEMYDAALNKTVNSTKTISRQKTKIEYLPEIDLGLKVYSAPTTNIRKGLDLEGGTRVLLQPEDKISADTMELLISSMKQRLNVYGLTDVVIRDATDLSQNQYVMVEIAGANEDEVRELIAKQGKFESRIGNKTIFIGGNDITYVCRSADCSGIDPNYGCGKSTDGYSCRFRFAITLSPDAAKRQADATSNLEVIDENGEQYLTEKLQLFLDDQLVDELNIGADLKGKVATDIQISGGGSGTTEQQALFNTLESMKRLQTVLITGSLPVKLNIAKTDSISPVLGKEFVNNSILLAILALASVTVILIIVYRRLMLAIPIILTAAMEVTLTLGVASLIGWNIDLAAIAGIIIAVGTGVNDQIVITDEMLSKKKKEDEILDWKKRIKKAFFIIIAAYFTVFVAMLPLLFAGAGLLKGFALTTIIGMSVGILLTRPAYSVFIKELIRK